PPLSPRAAGAEALHKGGLGAMDQCRLARPRCCQGASGGQPLEKGVAYTLRRAESPRRRTRHGVPGATGWGFFFSAPRRATRQGPGPETWSGSDRGARCAAGWTARLHVGNGETKMSNGTIYLSNGHPPGPRVMAVPGPLRPEG